ncbi:MAG TPA: hypothetical protein VLH13_02135 [Methanomassiliicoccales archaeon]|nr:hypothetical protein [Methanomassiliicoccales archaeon]
MDMPLLSYLLIFIALALIAWGMIIRAGNLNYIVGYKPDPKVEVREEDLKRFAGKNLILIGIVELIIAVAMIMMGSDDLMVFALTILFTLFIVFANSYAAKVMVVPKD